MTDYLVSINSINSPKRALNSPSQGRKKNPSIDIQYIAIHDKFSKTTVEFSKQGKRQANFNSLYRTLNSLKIRN